MKFEGTAVAMVTPFTANNEINEESLRSNINFLIENGVDGLLAAGTTGESATINHDEQKRLIDILVDEVNGRVTTFAGAGSNSTNEALNLVKHAKNADADFALVITPYYNKPQEHGLIQHYKLINDSIDMPIVLYNVPSRTGVDMSVESILKIAEFNNVVGIKEANPNVDKTSAIYKSLICNDLEDKFFILSGNDDLTIPLMSVGAKGVVSVVANVDPYRTSQMVNSFKNGDIKKAKDLHFKLYNLMKVLFIESNPVPTKYALNLMGKPVGNVRLPLGPLTKEHEQDIKNCLKELGLVKL
ncbi:MAG: 4-hydroxy-tetrahydrodipicolinate synthase [Methanobrevibacter sp.]|jgi:4-hydroxy-tetrahydrodipicolinate synthase|nr:4-hydroxy-tetrahydrodipicolinate synthase [Candidatus Methanovirga aequatorialis]